MSEWQSKEFSLLEFTICIVTSNLQKRQKPVLERFTAHGCCVKLFQVSAENGSPKAALILDQPASQVAVRKAPSSPASLARGEPRTPLIIGKKSKLSKRQFKKERMMK